MKIRLLVNQEEREKIKDELTSKGYEINDTTYEYTLVSNSPMDKLIGFEKKDMYLLNPKEVVYFESFRNDIVCHIKDRNYMVKYKLYEIENLFSGGMYLRVSNSFIVNLDHITSIRPTMNSKFILTMSNDDKVEVTRSYYALFKNFIEGGSK